MEKFTSTVRSFLTWQWVERLFQWLLTSGGTLSSIVFLASGLWMSVLKAVPDFIKQYVPSHLANLLTYLSKTAFTGLPEIILFVAVIKTLDQIKLIRETEKGSLVHSMAWLWTFLFGIPAVIFIAFSLTNIGLSLASSNYTMPDYVVIGRGLTCFVYALLCFIYDSRGNECFASKVKESTEKIKRLESDIETLKQKHQAEIETLNQQNDSFKLQKETLIIELESQKSDLENQLSMHQNKILHLAERASSLVLEPLERNFPDVKKEWIDQSIKSVTVDEIARVTGLPKSKIKKAAIRKAGRNGDLLLVSSVIDWLKTLPSNNYSHEYNDSENGHKAGDTDPLMLPIMSVSEQF